MSAEVLREAADKIRVDLIVGHSRGHASMREVHYGRAVAAWLDAGADKAERNTLAVTFDGSPMFPPDQNAIAVARAYPGESE